MKILMVADVPPDPNSGAAGTEYQTMLALRNLGHTVDAIWANDLRHRIRHGNLHYLLELPWAYRDAIRERTLDQQYDVIHVNQPYAWLAAHDHHRRGRSGVFVNRSHGWEPRLAEILRPWRQMYKVPEWRFPRGLMGRPMRMILHQSARFAARLSDGIIVSCSEDQLFLTTRYKLAPERVACIPQAPADAFIDKPVCPMTTERIKRVLYVGQASFFKAPQVLAAVFSRLAELHPELEFTWCCPASAHNHCLRLLNEQARERTSMVGWLPQEDLVRLYDKHGIFVFPSFGEGFGKVFLEAMARGLCVVGSNVAGMKDIIESSRTGWLVEPGDIMGFCDCIEALLRFNGVMEMSATAISVAQAYTWQGVGQKTEAFYKTLREAKQACG